MRNPDFIIVGSTLSSTQALTEVLNGHPAVFMPEGYDDAFFYSDQSYRDGVERYQHLFKGSTADLICGDASAHYLEKGLRLGSDNKIRYDCYEDSAVRIARDCPKVKIVICLKNPVMRAYTQYLQDVASGLETAENFETSIEDEIKGGRMPPADGTCRLYSNHYKIHLEHWISLVGRERVFILIEEEWAQGLGNGLHGLSDFLGLHNGLPESIPPTLNANANMRVLKYAFLRPFSDMTRSHAALARLMTYEINPAPINETTKAELRVHFTEDRAYLCELLGRRIEVW